MKLWNKKGPFEKKNEMGILKKEEKIEIARAAMEAEIVCEAKGEGARMI